MIMKMKFDFIASSLLWACVVHAFFISRVLLAMHTSSTLIGGGSFGSTLSIYD